MPEPVAVIGRVAPASQKIAFVGVTVPDEVGFAAKETWYCVLNVTVCAVCDGTLIEVADCCVLYRVPEPPVMGVPMLHWKVPAEMLVKVMLDVVEDVVTPLKVRFQAVPGGSPVSVNVIVYLFVSGVKEAATVLFVVIIRLVGLVFPERSPLQPENLQPTALKA